MAPGELRTRIRDAGLYLVITESFCAGRASVDVLEAALEGGVRLVQFREKEGEDRQVYAMARAFRERTRAHDALLIVDDRVDLALAVEAEGVHLGQRDLPIGAAKRIAPDLVVGLSTHSLEEAKAAEKAGADYINVGPVYATQTKQHSGGPLGPQLLTAVRKRSELPISCMGGIKLDSIPEVCATGIDAVAVITAVTTAGAPGAAAAELLAAIRAARGSKA